MTRGSDSSTYDDDFFAWTQQQAAALRRVPRNVIGELIDVEHVAEEIEDLGKRDLREVISFLARLLEHMMKITCASDANAVPHWRSEALNFQISAHDAFSSSMRRLVGIDEVWRRAGKLARVSGIAECDFACPFALDELLRDDFDLEAALVTLEAVKRSTGS